MGVLAQADRDSLRGAAEALPHIPLSVLRAPEIGLVMMRGRMGGGGRRFNLAEATVTRCAVTDGEVIGHGFALGRDKEKAMLIARCDALLQVPGTRDIVRRDVLEPLKAEIAEARSKARRRAAATRVDFFALVRGES
jgi:alpha-D-ribose 1-methylphosphonate 5-triphosphate synthase subunit PhnG